MSSITVKKAERRLILLMADGSERRYAVALGQNWASDKCVEGDCATPLGEFYVCAKNPRSKFFLSLHISYPNAEDAARGLASGLINTLEHAQILDAIRRGATPPQHTKLGGEICIHGRAAKPPMTAARDWTRGCIALDNDSMREVYEQATVGMPVIITD